MRPSACIQLFISDSPFSPLFDLLWSASAAPVVPWTLGRWLNSGSKIKLLLDLFCERMLSDHLSTKKGQYSGRCCGTAPQSQVKERLDQSPSVYIKQPNMTLPSWCWFSALLLECAYYELSYLYEWHIRQRERKKEKREELRGSSVSPFTLQERSHRGAEGMQSLAQSAWQDATLNMLISPLISTWKYQVLGRECKKPEIMSVQSTIQLFRSSVLAVLQ